YKDGRGGLGQLDLSEPSRRFDVLLDTARFCLSRPWATGDSLVPDVSGGLFPGVLSPSAVGVGVGARVRWLSRAAALKSRVPICPLTIRSVVRAGRCSAQRRQLSQPCRRRA